MRVPAATPSEFCSTTLLRISPLTAESLNPQTEKSLLEIDKPRAYSGRSIIVSDLPAGASSYDVVMLFSFFGPVQDCSIWRGPHGSPTPRRSALVTFESGHATVKVEQVSRDAKSTSPSAPQS